MSDFEAAGVAVYALSYDEADALEDFQKAHNISYTLLSDPESEVIRSFGILNTLIEEDDHPWFGIPYPGTYILDESGRITRKFFDSNLAVRVGPEQLLRAVQGKSISVSDSLIKPENTDTQGVELEVKIDGEHLVSVVQKDLVVSLSVPAHRHVYAEPAPEGSVAVNVVLDDSEKLVQRSLIRPVSERHKLAGTADVFQVHHGLVELRLPLTLNSALSPKDTQVTVSGEVFWQTCDDMVCDVPESRRFELTVPVTHGPAVALRGGVNAELEPNARAHFAKMTSRRKS